MTQTATAVNCIRNTGLRICIYQQDTLTSSGKPNSEIDRGDSFSDAAFLIGDGSNLTVIQAHFRQRIIRYSEKHGVTKATDRFRISRHVIYEWKAKYDGNWKSLLDRSHRPHHHPAEHTQEEYDLIRRYWYRNKDDRMILWMKIREQGYSRGYKSMCRALKRMQLESTEKLRQTYKPKPYAAAKYPGQKVQIDVKFVPRRCVAGDTKYYQYTAVSHY